MLDQLRKGINSIFSNEWLRQKILITLLVLGIYRLLVMIPVPFVNIDALMAQTQQTATDGLASFLMLFGWSLDQFSIIAVGLAPFINASIIVQLLTVVIPHFEELQELGEQGSKQLQIYMRYITFPLAFIQSIGMVFFINSLSGWLVDTGSWMTVLLSAFVLAVGSMIMVFIWDIITEKGITNGSSLLIFASIIAGIVTQVSGSLSAWDGLTGILSLIAFMLIIVLGLIFLSIFILKSMKQIPVIYARQWKIQESSKLPIPLNPVGMIPIIFAMAFVTFPYIISQLVLKFGYPSDSVRNFADWINTNLNLYTSNPEWPAIVVYFLFVIFFTYFYSLITFNPDKMSDTIQKRWWFIPGIRPGDETALYIKDVLNHLSRWWWVGLGLLAIYSYILYKIPFIQDMSVQLWSIPVVVTWSGIIIIVWVIQQLMDKVQTEVLMSKYDNQN